MRLDQEIFAAAESLAAEVEVCPCPEIPALDGKVFARRMDTNTYVAFAKDIPDGSDPYPVTRLLLFALCDAKGQPIFERDAMGMARLNKLPAVVTLRWKRIVERLNYMGQFAADIEGKSEAAGTTTSS